MTPAELAVLVRYKTRTNATVFTDAQILPLLNQRIDEIAQDVLKADEDFFLVPQTDDLVANQREYPQPSDILSRIKRTEAKLGGTDWVPLTEIDITKINSPISLEAEITAVFNNLQVSRENPAGARFDIIRKSVYILSGTIIDVTDGLKIWCMTWPAHVTDLTSTTDLSVDPSTTTHAIPRAMHKSLVTGVVIDFKESKEKPIPLNETELAYRVDKEKAIETLKHGNLEREVFGYLPGQSDRGNEGQDF